MDRKTVFTKTAKGLMEVTGRTSLLARDQRDVLASIDGRATVGDLQRKLGLDSDSGLMETLARLVKDGFAREFVTSPTSLSPASQISGTRGDLDFSGVALARNKAEKAREEAEAAAVGRQVRESRARHEHDAAERARRHAAAKAQRDAEKQARREAEEKARREAEEKAQREAEEKARREAEERARYEAEEQARREAEEKARREAEEKAQREAEEKARREAEERARYEAEEQARREAEEKARRKAEEKARRKAEEKARREAEAQARREAGEQARREAEEKAQREAEQKARREAEARIKREAERGRREREAEAARAREEQRRREAAQARELEAELAERERALAAERAARAQIEAPAQAGAQALAAELAAVERAQAQVLDAQRARAREETEARVQARQAQHAAERAQAEARAAARERENVREAAEVANRLWRIRHGKSRGRQVGLYVLVALLLAVGALYALQWVRIDAAPYAAWAQRTLGMPVKVATASWVFAPLPVLRLQDVRVGAASDVRIAQVRATPDWLAWMGASPQFDHLELRGIRAPVSALGTLLRVAPTARVEGLSGVALEQVVLEVPGMRLPPMSGHLRFGATPTELTLEDDSKGLTFDLLPQGDGSARFELWAGDARALVPALTLADLRVRGSVSPVQADIAQFDARVHDGVIRGRGVLGWAGGWHLDGTLTATSLSVADFTPAAEGRLGGEASFAARGTDFGTLFSAPGLTGRFEIAQGRVSGIDLPRSLQAGAAVVGETPFDTLTGQVHLERGRLELRDLQLRAGALRADANVGLADEGVLDGRVAAQLRIPAGVVRGEYALVGTAAAPRLQR